MSTHACAAHFASSSISNLPCPVPNRRPKHDARLLQGRAERLRVRDRPRAGGFEFSLGGNRVAMAIHDLNLKLRVLAQQCHCCGEVVDRLVFCSAFRLRFTAKTLRDNAALRRALSVPAEHRPQRLALDQRATLRHGARDDCGELTTIVLEPALPDPQCGPHASSA